MTKEQGGAQLSDEELEKLHEQFPVTTYHGEHDPHGQAPVMQGRVTDERVRRMLEDHPGEGGFADVMSKAARRLLGRGG